MENTATLTADGCYDLSVPIKPFEDDMTFPRLRLIEHPDRTIVLALDWSGQDHPVPLHQSAGPVDAATALAAIGYTLAG